MTDGKEIYVSLPIKDFVDREIAALKEKVYVELDARAKALELAHKDEMRQVELTHKVNMHRVTIIVALVGIGITLIEILAMVVLHFWK